MSASDIDHPGVGSISDAASAGTVRDALSGAADALAAAGVESPRLDAEVLLAEATRWERARLAADPDAGIPAAAGRRFAETVRRRLRREPVAYILGRKGFRHIELAVDRRVLIPRPESELLVELALELRPRRVLDVGTGSGAIALAIAAELPECEVTATDTSAAALEVARANAERLCLAGRVELSEGALPPWAGAGSGVATPEKPASDLNATPEKPASDLNATPEKPASDLNATPEKPAFDLIVANLPYVSESEWGSLAPEVTEWEPREALLAGPEGLDSLRAVIPKLAPLAPIVGLEVGAGQAEAVGGMLRDAGFAETEIRRDLAGIERVVVSR